MCGYLKRAMVYDVLVPCIQFYYSFLFCFRTKDHQKFLSNTFKEGPIDASVEFIQLEEDYELVSTFLHSQYSSAFRRLVVTMWHTSVILFHSYSIRKYSVTVGIDFILPCIGCLLRFRSEYSVYSVIGSIVCGYIRLIQDVLWLMPLEC